jgi:hypothetical protein
MKAAAPVSFVGLVLEPLLAVATLGDGFIYRVTALSMDICSVTDSGKGKCRLPMKE